MNKQPQNKVLILIIGILLVANIATLSFFMMKKCDKPRTTKSDKKVMISNFLQQEVGFTKEQLNRYDTMSKQHRLEMRQSFDGMATQREQVFTKLAGNDFNDSAIQLAAVDISNQQKDFELLMLRHLDEIRGICTPQQKPIFDAGFYKIISKRGGREKK